MIRNRSALGLVAALLCTGCGGGDDKPASEALPTPAASVSTGASTPSPTVEPVSAGKGTDLLAAWCDDVRLGDSKSAVLKVMGKPNGNKADAYKVSGIDSVEWDVGATILLASFEGGIATNLQAYDGAVGPQGSSRIKCESFRNSG